MSHSGLYQDAKQPRYPVASHRLNYAVVCSDQRSLREKSYVHADMTFQVVDMFVTLEEFVSLGLSQISHYTSCMNPGINAGNPGPCKPQPRK